MSVLRSAFWGAVIGVWIVVLLVAVPFVARGGMRDRQRLVAVDYPRQFAMDAEAVTSKYEAACGRLHKRLRLGNRCVVSSDGRYVRMYDGVVYLGIEEVAK